MTATDQTSDVDDMDAPALHAALTFVGARLAEIETEREALYDRRLALFLRGRALDPQVPFAAMARAVGCTEQAACSAVNDRKRRVGKLAAAPTVKASPKPKKKTR